MSMRAVCLILQNDYEFDPRVRRKAEALASAGYSVDVLALRASSGRRRYTLNGVNVETVGLGKKRGTLARYGFEYLAFLVWAFVRVHLLTWRRRYAVIDVNTLPDFLVFAPLFARLMGAKVLLDMHEITPEFYMSKYGVSRTSWLVRLLTFIERISFNFADHVVTINDPILDLLVGRGLDPARTTVIMNSADESPFLGRQTDTSVVDRTGATFVMIYHGTLTRIYGLDIAIEAFAAASAQMPGAQFWILGSGPQSEELQALARERGLEGSVRLFGRVPAAQIPSWLMQCDAGILPIRSDVFLEFAFPNKLPEYIVTDTPAIVSRLRGIRQYFGEDALAYATPNDPADLACQMLRLYRDPDLRSRLAARAKEQYAPIRWEVMRARYVNLVNELASAGSVAS
jgi:glycosyltransferase involved in cell wall biosynthesis